MSNRTSFSIVPPELADEPSTYLNPGGKAGEPFAVVSLGPGAWLFIYEPGHARAVAAAFTKAAGLLETHAAAQDGGQP